MSTEFNFYVLLPGAKFVVPGSKACFFGSQGRVSEDISNFGKKNFPIFFRQIILFIVLPRLHVF